MEEPKKNIFDSFLVDVKERLRSVLVASFVITWLVINWQIPLGLLLYTREDLANNKWTDYIDFVKDIYVCKSEWLAFLYAILYVILIAPLFRFITKTLSDLSSIWSDTTVIRLSKSAKIPIDKFVALNEALNEKQKIYEELMSGQSDNIVRIQNLTNTLDSVTIEKEAFKNEKESLSKEVNQFKEQLIKMTSELDLYRSRENVVDTNPEIMDGTYSVKSDNKFLDNTQLEFRNGVVYIGPNRTKVFGSITHFSFKKLEIDILFSLDIEDKVYKSNIGLFNSSVIVFHLKPTPILDLLTGTIDSAEIIQLEVIRSPKKK